MSKFFIERPVFAKVLALVILLIGGSASASANLTIPKRQPLRPSPATQHHGAAVRPSISREMRGKPSRRVRFFVGICRPLQRMSLPRRERKRQQRVVPPGP